MKAAENRKSKGLNEGVGGLQRFHPTEVYPPCRLSAWTRFWPHDPVAVFEAPNRPPNLPTDAILVTTEDRLGRGQYAHKEVVGVWRSDLLNCNYTLIAYELQSNKEA